MNARRPWAARSAALSRDNNETATTKLRLVKGSHIVVPRIDGADVAFLFQNADGRVIFVLPFEDEFTLIGTTDVPVTGSPSDAACSPEEEAYLTRRSEPFLATPLSPRDIVCACGHTSPAGERKRSKPIPLSAATTASN